MARIHNHHTCLSGVDTGEVSDYNDRREDDEPASHRRWFTMAVGLVSR
jgi:hypothetical protein